MRVEVSHWVEYATALSIPVLLSIATFKEPDKPSPDPSQDGAKEA